MIVTMLSQNFYEFVILLLYMYFGLYESRFSQNSLANMWSQNGGLNFRQETLHYNSRDKSSKVKGNDLNDMAAKMAEEKGKICE